MNKATTSAIRLTPIGRGAVATIRVKGNLVLLDRFFHSVNGLSASQQLLNRICYGVWGDDHREDLIGVRTSTSVFELHCHGGAAAVDRILSDLEVTGIQIIQSQIIQLLDPAFQDELRHCLQQATTQKTAHQLLRQTQLLPSAIESFSQLDDSQRRVVINEMLRWSQFGQHLTSPWRVVLCGSPNVGKSSLINALVGYSRSVVYDQPGTTRDVVTVQTALDGWPIQFSDTAGIRMTTENLESLGIEKAKATIQTADLLLVVMDAREEVSTFETSLLIESPKSLLVVNKVDLVQHHQMPAEALSVSAINSHGLEELAARIVKELVPEVPSHEQAFPVTARQEQFLISLLEQ